MAEGGMPMSDQKMDRGRFEIKRIENHMTRQVTFCKRRNHLFTKAYEMSVLCNVDVALIIVRDNGQPYEYNTRVKDIMEKYKKVHSSDDGPTNSSNELTTLYYEQEIAKLRHQLGQLENAISTLLGSNAQINLEDYKNSEKNLEGALEKIHARKLELIEHEVNEMEIN